MRNSTQRQHFQVGQNLTGPPLIEPSSTSRPPKSRNDLEVDQLRCDELLPTQSLADPITVSAVIRESRRKH